MKLHLARKTMDHRCQNTWFENEILSLWKARNIFPNSTANRVALPWYLRNSLDFFLVGECIKIHSPTQMQSDFLFPGWVFPGPVSPSMAYHRTTVITECVGRNKSHQIKVLILSLDQTLQRRRLLASNLWLLEADANIDAQGRYLSVLMCKNVGCTQSDCRSFSAKWGGAKECKTFSDLVAEKKMSSVESMVGGGFKYFYFHPKPWGNDPIWRAYFSDGLKPLSSIINLKMK